MHTCAKGGTLFTSEKRPGILFTGGHSSFQQHTSQDAFVRVLGSVAQWVRLFKLIPFIKWLSYVFFHSHQQQLIKGTKRFGHHATSAVGVSEKNNNMDRIPNDTSLYKC